MSFVSNNSLKEKIEVFSIFIDNCNFQIVGRQNSKVKYEKHQNDRSL